MKKTDLRTGMRVTIRDGSQFIVLLDVPIKTTGQYVDILRNKSGFLNLEDYDDNLWDCNHRKYDIIRVEVPQCKADIFRFNAEYDVVWERPFRELTLHEIEKELGCSIQIIGGVN